MFLRLGPPGQQASLPLFQWKQVGPHYKQVSVRARALQQNGNSVGLDPSWPLQKHFRKHAILMLCK